MRNQSEVEVWVKITGFEWYEISDFGRVRSIDKIVNSKNNSTRIAKGKVLKPNLKSSGYLTVDLYDKGHNYKLIHRLVAEAFIPNILKLNQVNHKDEDKTNNSIDNLEWCTAKYNSNYGSRNSRISRQIEQVTIEGEYLKTFDSAMEVERMLGFKNQNIINCCIGNQKTSNGYFWRYAERKEV